MSHPGSQLHQLPLLTLETRDVKYHVGLACAQAGPCTKQALRKHLLTYCVVVG